MQGAARCLDLQAELVVAVEAHLAPSGQAWLHRPCVGRAVEPSVASLAEPLLVVGRVASVVPNAQLCEHWILGTSTEKCMGQTGASAHTETVLGQASSAAWP